MAEAASGFSKARLEAFSDGVIAVIITIMVLDLRAPRTDAPGELLTSWPSFLIYLISYLFVAIYWINHHSLLATAARVTPLLIWANGFLLFCLSLVPFATAYVANTKIAVLPTVVYAALQCVRGVGFTLILTVIMGQRRDDADFMTHARARAGVHYEMTRPWLARRDLVDKAEAVLSRVGLLGRAAQRASSLSHGDQRKLEVAMMMALEPDILMFDEPTAGMSVDEVPVLLDLIAGLKRDASKTILLVEHKMDVVRSLADRIIVLHNGRLVADGEPAEVIASPIVQEAYLGVAPEARA